MGENKNGEEETTVAMKARSASLMQNQKFCCPVFLLYFGMFISFFHIGLCECLRQIVWRRKKIPQVVAFLFDCALGNCIVGLNKDVPVQMCCIRTNKSMQNFIFTVGIFWWKLCLPIFALCGCFNHSHLLWLFNCLSPVWILGSILG